MSQPDEPKLADIFSFNAKIAELAHERSIASYRYLVERRDRMLDRLRLGAFSVNAATLFGALSVLGSVKRGKFEQLLDPFEPMLLLLIVGIVCAGLSLLLAHRRFVDDSSKAANELRDLQTISARMVTALEKRNVDNLGRDIAKLKEHGVPEFSHSAWEYRCLAVSLGSWFTAAMIPMVNLATSIDWSIQWPWNY